MDTEDYGSAHYESCAWGLHGGREGHCDILSNRELCTVKESHQMTRSEQYTRSAFIDCRVEGT